jgi:hypothetical protein
MPVFAFAELGESIDYGIFSMDGGKGLSRISGLNILEA